MREGPRLEIVLFEHICLVCRFNKCRFNFNFRCFALFLQLNIVINLTGEMVQ